MSAILALLVAVFLTLLVNRIATVALMFTGLSHDMARFQARSALCTVGFTTVESEEVVNHPVRRRIIGTLMLMGNMGFVTLVATGMGSLESLRIGGEFNLQTQICVLVGGLAALWAIGMSKWVDRQMFLLISWALKHWTRLEIHDYQALLQLGEGYTVTELKLDAGDWIVGKRLEELRLNDIGINVLGLHRKDRSFLCSPVGGTYLRRSDRVIIYGSCEAIETLDNIKSDPSHEEKHFRFLKEIEAKRKNLSEEQAAAFCMAETQVDPTDWAAGRRLSELAVDDRQVSVLGIERADGDYVETPDADTPIYAGDTLIMYGGRNAMAKIREASSGEEIREVTGGDTRTRPR